MLHGKERSIVLNTYSMLNTHHFLPSTYPKNSPKEDHIYRPNFLILMSYNSDSHLETNSGTQGTSSSIWRH